MPIYVFIQSYDHLFKILLFIFYFFFKNIMLGFIEAITPV